MQKDACDEAERRQGLLDLGGNELDEESSCTRLFRLG